MNLYLILSMAAIIVIVSPLVSSRVEWLPTDIEEPNKIFENEFNRTILQAFIIQEYKGTVRNTLPILKQIELLQTPEQKLAGYHLLLDEMVKHRHLYTVELMTLAYRVHMTEAPEALATNEDCIAIQDHLPWNVRNFPWNKTIRLQNKEFPEFVYSPDDSLAKSADNRHVFSGQERASCNDNSCLFALRPKADDPFSLQIVNTEKNELLYAGNSETLYDNDRRSVYFWRKTIFTPAGGDSWMFAPLASESGFRIYNTFYGEYLYSPVNGFKYDAYRRHVFTWIPLGCDGKACIYNVKEFPENQGSCQC